MSYCNPSDLYSWGVPRGATPNPGRVLFSVLDDVCTLDVHGFVTGDEILFRPSGDGELPAELTPGVTFFVQLETEHTFKVRATAEGASISITDAEDPVLVIAPLPIAAAIEWADAIIDDALTAHAVPLDPVPPIVRMTAAELAAAKLLGTSGGSSKSLAETVDGALKRLERWRIGKPVEGADADTRENTASAAASTRTDCRGWRTFGGL